MEYKEYEKLNYDTEYEKKGYPKKLWPILNEYFSRFKYEYELSDLEINERLERLTANLDKIKIGKFGNSFKADGIYESSKKIIKIKVDSDKHAGIDLNLIDSLFHELNHVTDMSSNKDPKTKKGKIFSYDFQKFDEKKKLYYGVFFNEIITELKSKRLFYNEKDNNTNFSEEKVSLGYNNILFIGSMIHTTLGISEREFLTYACKGKEKFDEVMREKFDDNAYDDFINSIYYYSDIAYSKKNSVDVVDRVKELCLYTMEKRMQHEKNLYNEKDQRAKFAIKCKTELQNLNEYYSKGKGTFIDEKIEIKENENYDVLYNVFGNEFDFSSIEINDKVNIERQKQWNNTELQENIKNIDKKNYIFSQIVGKYKDICRYINKKEKEVIQRLKTKKNKFIGLPQPKEKFEEETCLCDGLKKQVKSDNEILQDNSNKKEIEQLYKDIEDNVYEK